MYTIYIPKYNKKTGKTPITRVISGYMNCQVSEFGIISSPGYMSREDTNIKNFVEEFAKDISSGATKKINISYANGMNGSRKVTGTTDTISEVMKRCFSPKAYPMLCYTDMAWKKSTDHRKMLFFYKVLVPYTQTKPITFKEIDDFLNTIEVTAVMIGSSNQSHHTYYSSPSGTVTKGEADIFMFAQDDPFEHCVVANGLDLSDDKESDSTVMDEVVISVSKYLPAGDAHCFFRDMLKDFLENSLRKK